jgi:hypothetical protein
MRDALTRAALNSCLGAARVPAHGGLGGRKSDCGVWTVGENTQAEGSDSGDMSSQRMAKHLLAKIFKQVVGFKMASHLHEEHGGGYVQGLEMM